MSQTIQSLTPEQQQALLDLLFLGMYADQHLAAAEDERIQKLIAAFGLPSEGDGQRWLDASATRVRGAGQSPETIRSFVATAARAFPTPQARSLVLKELEAMLGSDGRVSERESEFLKAVREVLGK